MPMVSRYVRDQGVRARLGGYVRDQGSRVGVSVQGWVGMRETRGVRAMVGGHVRDQGSQGKGAGM